MHPRDFACAHVATPEEGRRDPAYQACGAAAGEPCRWAQRHDGEPNPAFHTDRLEAAQWLEPHTGQITDEAFEQACLDTGLI